MDGIAIGIKPISLNCELNMPNYKIQYNYNTGNSIKIKHNIIEILEFTWTNIEIAKENLNRIREHYEYYLLLHSFKYRHLNKNKQEEELEKVKIKYWFVKEHEGSLIFKTDNGRPCQFHAPWCGYFESLNEAEIIED